MDAPPGKVEAPAARQRQPGRPSWLARAGNIVFRHRKRILPLGLLALFVVFRTPSAERRLDLGVDLIGLLFCLTGQFLRAMVVGFAYIKRGGHEGRVYAEGLVMEGLFGHSRNPLYVGNILILLGLLIIYNNIWVYVLGVPHVLFVYSAIVAAEEFYLRGKFGDLYDDYCRRVNRWIPDPRGLSRSLAGMHYNWRRLILKEYGSSFAWILAVLALLYYEVYPSSGDHPGAVRALLGLFLFFTACWLTARYLKKFRILKDRTPPAPGAPPPSSLPDQSPGGTPVHS
ncbi:MAG: methyltransferase family protein [Acidobacteriota bacterium]